MKPSQTCLTCHFLGVLLALFGLIINIVTGNTSTFAISLGAMSTLFVIGVESDLYGHDEEMMKQAQTMIEAFQKKVEP